MVINHFVHIAAPKGNKEKENEKEKRKKAQPIYDLPVAVRQIKKERQQVIQGYKVDSRAPLRVVLSRATCGMTRKTTIPMEQASTAGTH